ncbi:hypothetical protein EP073_07225 [Geovibrio thiophilus]|uniref:Uncharacterized protein n=1 Tax=Geovibrio thiophilus TaxID=139438 RepID=A0A410JYD8_9BACT|nr:hypothetical protein [Geovibrio thiophilus]QAR33200.1 hypothetical protein EP073_07225 [Geovibrio thiophilus]
MLLCFLFIFSTAAYGADSAFPPETLSHLDILNSGRITVIGSSPEGLKVNDALRRARIEAEEKAHAILSDLPVSGLRTLEDAALFDNESEHVFRELLSSLSSCKSKGIYDKAKKKGYYCLTGRIDPLEILAEKSSAAVKSEPDGTAAEYDSVIINAAVGVFVPALMNRIYAADGTEIWNRAFGHPVYVTDMPDAVTLLFQEGRRKPLSLNAERVASYTDVYLGKTASDELKRLLSAGTDVKIVFAFLK